MKRLAAVVSFGVCAISGRASAEHSATNAPSHAKQGPSRGADEFVDRADAAYTELVAAADADGNEQVNAGELLAVVRRYVRKQVEVRFRRLDRNHDGRVTRSEVPRMDAARFTRLDADANGAFTVVELERTMQHQAATRCRAVFARLDVDRDGELSALDAETARSTRVSSR
jgi:hypothetical protein